MSFNPNYYDYPFPSRRQVQFARRGMVCTTQPLAAQAGLSMLQRGGNAIDAAVATAIAMTVLEPTSNGIGSDAFALIWTGEGLQGLNASGPAPAKFDLDYVRKTCGDKMPDHGWIPVTVPGAPAAWAELSRKYGKLKFADLFEPAIHYARYGYPLAVTTARSWQRAYTSYKAIFKEDYFQPWFETFSPQGRVPRAGESVTLLGHAKTLEALAASNCESFYRGEIADQIDQFFQKIGGWLSGEDLASFHPEWVEPISTDYHGYTVSEIPPNGHGIIALMALNILDGFHLNNQTAPETYHKQIEAMKLAFSDGQAFVADPSAMDVSTEALLSPDYARERRALIGEEALLPQAGRPDCGGTIYLCTADGEGNMVSYIQSNYKGFGSGLVVPGTGISLQDRGANFYLDPASANCAAPHKKPYHTIIPGFLSQDGRPLGPFGVMGGFMQPQGHVQVVMNLIDFQLNPQQALDAPRWQWVGEKKVQVEQSFAPASLDALIRRGHQVEIVADNSVMGRGQIILRGEDGVLAGGSEARADGSIALF